MNAKRVVYLWLFSTLSTLGLVLLFNYFIDPLWCFDHSNRWNNRQPGFNERQQKTNRLYFTGIRQYDTLMLGSSRTAYIDQHDLLGMKAFNYAADNMLPGEYERWLGIAVAMRGSPFKTVVIGIDFFGTAKNYDSFIERLYQHKVPRDYLAITQRPFYRYKSLLGFDALEHSAESVRRTYRPTVNDYDRKNVRRCNVVVSPDKKKEYIRRDIEEYAGHMGEAYRYRDSWPRLIGKLRKKYPRTRFIFFTTPVSRPFFENIVLKGGRLEDYFRWLRETAEATGGFFHFMDLNSVTTDLSNFFDGHHMYTKGTRWIAHRVSNPNAKDVPKDFGLFLRPGDVETYIQRVRRTLPRLTNGS